MLEQIGAVTPARLCTSHTFDLGQHILKVLEDQSVLVVDHAANKEAVQLDREESYRLSVVLQSVFTSESSV